MMSCAVTVSAGSSTNDQMKELAKISGVYEQLNEGVSALSKHAEKLAEDLTNQVNRKNSNIPESVQLEIQNEVQAEFERIPTYFDIEMIVSKYVELMVPQLTETEANSVITFFHTEAGKKYAEGNTAITPKLSDAMMADFQPKLIANMKSFSERLQAIVAKQRD